MNPLNINTNTHTHFLNLDLFERCRHLLLGLVTVSSFFTYKRRFVCLYKDNSKFNNYFIICSFLNNNLM